MENQHHTNQRMIALITILIMLIAATGTVAYAANTGTAQDAPAASVTLDCRAVTLQAGALVTLRASVSPAAAVTWESSDPGVAGVDQTGTVKAVKPGGTVVTATAGGQSAACRVNVSLSRPSGVTGSAAGVTTININWRTVTGAEGYRLYRSAKPDGRYANIATLGSGITTYRDQNRKTGERCYYKVSAYCGQYDGPSSAAAPARAVPLKTKVKLKAGSGSMKISWEKISGASGYRIYRATKPDGSYKAVKTIKKHKTMAWRNRYLKGGTKYYYKVRAYKTVSGKRVLGLASAVVGKKTKKVNLKYNKAHNFYYKKKFTVKAYSYTGGGHTASGTRARVGAIAVDPNVIRLGTKVYVNGYGFARAEDTGGNIKGKTIDVYKNSLGACNSWGVRYETIYLGVRKCE